MKKYVDRLQIHFDFPAAQKVRLTTPYFQKEISLNKQDLLIELERLKEVKAKAHVDIPDNDFFVSIEYKKSKNSYKYYVYAKTNEKEPSVIESFNHNEEQTIKVNIYRG